MIEYQLTTFHNWHPSLQT